jgi:hypothetical protein
MHSKTKRQNIAVKAAAGNLEKNRIESPASLLRYGLLGEFRQEDLLKNYNWENARLQNWKRSDRIDPLVYCKKGTVRRQ